MCFWVHDVSTYLFAFLHYRVTLRVFSLKFVILGVPVLLRASDWFVFNVVIWVIAIGHDICDGSLFTARVPVCLCVFLHTFTSKQNVWEKHIRTCYWSVKNIYVRIHKLQHLTRMKCHSFSPCCSSSSSCYVMKNMIASIKYQQRENDSNKTVIKIYSNFYDIFVLLELISFKITSGSGLFQNEHIS